MTADLPHTCPVCGGSAGILEIAQAMESAAGASEVDSYLRPRAYVDLLSFFTVSHRSEPMPLGAVEFSGPFCPWEKESALRDIETLMTRRRRVHLVYTRKSITVCYYAERATQASTASDPWSDHQAAAGAR